MSIYNIAVFVAGLDEEYQSSIISGINSYARKNRINVSYFAAYGGVLNSKCFDIGEYSIYSLADLSRFDGAVLMINTINDAGIKQQIVDMVRKTSTPAVIFGCQDYPDIFNISIDNKNPIADMVRHVVNEHGAKVINYISGPVTNPEARDRLGAFRDTMAELGLTVEEDRIFYGEFRSADGYNAVEEFIRSGKELPDAFICANDAMALAAISALEQYGLCVPLDVIVTGFDNIFSAQNNCPALTTVTRPLSEMGTQGLKVLLDIISGSKPSPVVVDASCLFTESCGCKLSIPDDYTEYKKRTFNKIELTNYYINRLNILNAHLAESETAQDNFSKITDFVRELGFPQFMLCLAEDWQDVFSSGDPGKLFSGTLTAPIIWNEGESSSVEYFNGRDMFPVPLENGGNICYFLPLHFREHCLGYYIVINNDFPTKSLLCHTLSMNISHSLENIRKLTHLNSAMEELNKLYVIDPLCNIYNRNGFIRITNDIFNNCIKENSPVMLTFIDMDGLKFINDNYGHNEGDFAIQRLASVISESCRQNQICARFGGDEFVIFSHHTAEGDAEAIERRINSKLDSINSIICKPYKISASLGSVNTIASPDKTLYSLIKQADDIMYEVKKLKKNSRSASDHN